MKEKKRKKWGDRRDARLVRDIDALHKIMPYMFPHRCDNEAFITEEIDLTALNEYINAKNLDCGERKYTIFQFVCCAFVKVLTLRPQLNRFIQNKKLYQRDKLSLSFVIKRQFTDSASEGLAFMLFDDKSTIDSVHTKIVDEIYKTRSGSSDGAENSLKLLAKLPRFILGFLARIMGFLDVKGLLPRSIADTDMGYASVFISNLGSIKLNSGYHHLTNRGTNSIFVIIGEKKLKPFYDEANNVQMREVLPLGLTIDERISDGFYFAKSIKLLKYLLQNPQELELEAYEEVKYDK